MFSRAISMFMERSNRSRRERYGVALDLGDLTTDLSLIGPTNVAKPARGRAATIDTGKQARAVADLGASCF